MNIKDFIISRFQLFCFLVTMILFAEYIISIVTVPDQTLHNEDLMGPIAAAGLCIIPTFVTYFKKEPTINQYISRLILQLILIEVIMLAAVKPDSVAGVNKTELYISIFVSTLIIYCVAVLIMYYRNYIQSKALTKDLRSFQEKECT